MSQQNKPTNHDETAVDEVPEEVVAAFTEETVEVGEESELKSEEELKPNDESGSGKNSKTSEKLEPEKKPKKKMSKGVKYGVLVFVWLLMLGGAVGLAFVMRPKEEIAAGEEEFKWNEAERESAELVDVSFYGMYDTNAIEFEYPYRYISDKTTYENVNPEYSKRLQSTPQIKGLKDKDVQAKINSRIVDVVSSFEFPGEDQNVGVRIGDNMFNVLSLLLDASYRNGDSGDYRYVYDGISFDLTTGDELTFDDIFVKGANIESIVFKKFYKTLSTKYSFDIVYAERGIQERESGNCLMWCDENVSLEEYRARKEKAENNLANVEEIAINEAKKYLSGEKKFYLESAGPVLIYNEDSGLGLTDYYAPDDVQYFAYLGKYRTSESIYEDDSVGIKNVFLSAVNMGLFDFGWVEENDRFFVDFLCANVKEKEKALEVAHDLVQRIMDKSDNSKYYYILMPDVDVSRKDNYWVIDRGYASMYEMDKNYYNKVFRKAIFEGKTHRVGAAESPNPSPNSKSYDKNAVTIKDLSDYGISQVALMDNNGVWYETVEDIFEPGVKLNYRAGYEMFYKTFDDVDEKDWKELLIDYFYSNIYKWDNGRRYLVNYSDEDKAMHKFEYEFVKYEPYGIRIILKSGDEDSSEVVSVDSNKIPNEYLKEPFRH